MAISVFDLFSVGIGPSSSHTVGPMRAARQFLLGLELAQVARVKAELYGSLALTGRGHGTDKAVLLGLMGHQPETVDTQQAPMWLAKAEQTQTLSLLGAHPVEFTDKDLVFYKRKVLPHHSNGMRFSAFDDTGALIEAREYYSVGGGFVVTSNEADKDRIVPDTTPLPYPFANADALLEMCRAQNKRISDIMLANEQAWRSKDEVRTELLKLWEVMQGSIEAGCHNAGTLPGGLKVTRRAPILYHKLAKQGTDGLLALDWVNLWAIAVNEENAAAGRVVTAPTNGAAGILPAVLNYYQTFCQGTNEGVIEFLLTAGAVGILFKQNASISGAEVGCQGEVGVACSMAAAGLTAALGGTLGQVENAAEIGMEHNLGLTCDPIGGLVQIPCIERNAMGAIKAINAQRMAMQGDGKHRVSLDKVIETMRKTGADMSTKYKETSRGGLAVTVIEC